MPKPSYQAADEPNDNKDFTYYPRSMRARFTRYSAPWTYMTKAERYKPAFVRPKRMFKRCEFKKTQKGKVFAVTTSTGKLLMAHCPLPFDSDAFARIIRRRVGPFFVKEFPDRRKRVILLDGEPLFHAPPAQAAFKEFGLSVLPRWPPYSPDLNPAEHLWQWIEAEMRKMKKKDRLLRGVQAAGGARGSQVPKQREAHTIDGAPYARVYRSEGGHDQALMGAGQIIQPLCNLLWPAN